VRFNVWRRFPQDFFTTEIFSDDVALYSPILWQPIDRAAGKMHRVRIGLDWVEHE
jgi:hypothetical protein